MAQGPLCVGRPSLCHKSSHERPGKSEELKGKSAERKRQSEEREGKTRISRIFQVDQDFSVSYITIKLN